MNKKIEILRRIYRNRFAKRTEFSKKNVSGEEWALAKQIKENSIVIIPDFLSKETTEKMRNRLDEEFARYSAEEQKNIFHQTMSDVKSKYGVTTEQGYRIWFDKNGSDKRIFDAQLLLPEFNDFFSSSFLRNTGSAFLNEWTSANSAMVNKTEFVDGNLGSGGGWHRDMNYAFGFKALVYLTDVTTENGPFQLIPKSSRAFFHFLKTDTPDKYQYTDEEVLRLVSDKVKITEVTGKAGTLVLFDTNCIHRGKPIQRGVRYALTNYYLDKK